MSKGTQNTLVHSGGKPIHSSPNVPSHNRLQDLCSVKREASGFITTSSVAYLDRGLKNTPNALSSDRMLAALHTFEFIYIS